MIDSQKLKECIDRAAAEAVQKYEAELQKGLQEALAAATEGLKKSVRKAVMAELEPELATPPGGAPTDLANAAVASIQDASTQTEILGALLGGAEKFSERCGLLVVKGNVASGWQCRGIDQDAFKQVKLDTSKGLTERAVRTRGPVAGAADEFDTGFVGQFGAPADGNVILLPLVVRDRVAALLYADGGAQGSQGLDASGVELLVRATDLWLEVISLRKVAEQTGGGEAHEHEEVHEAVPKTPTPAQEAPTQKQPAFREPEPEPEPAAAAPPPPPPPPPPAPAPAAAAAAAAPAVEDEVHKKAKRFAKLLVDEIKLYNKDKVEEGRKNNDLYDRLKEDIEKSRETYKKRYAETVTDVDYFANELVRILAGDDRSKMGANFHG